MTAEEREKREKRVVAAAREWAHAELVPMGPVSSVSIATWTEQRINAREALFAAVASLEVSP